MLDGTRLQLLIGPAPLPIPAPPPVIDALQSVEVRQSRGRNGFTLTLMSGKTSPIQLALLPAGFFDPIKTRVVITVIHRGLPQVLIDGIVTQQTLAPANEPGATTLTLTGEDLGVLMDLDQVRKPWKATPEAARIAAILAKYAVYGVVPKIIPPPVISVDSPTSRFDIQNDTDRAYVAALAEESGYAFYIDPGPLPMMSFAYFGPDHRLPILQPALNVNMDADTNVESLSFTFNGMARKKMKLRVLDPATNKVAIPLTVPAINPLHLPLGLKPTPAVGSEFVEDTSKLTASEAAKRVFGLTRQNKDAITANGSLNVASYGSVLRAGRMVGVRGAGLAYDGPYYVESVTHNLRPGEYRQSFNIARDGLMTPTPVVVP